MAGNLHAALDRAVWAAYGRDDPDPSAVPDDAILARLLVLNLERAGRIESPLTAQIEDRHGHAGLVKRDPMP